MGMVRIAWVQFGSCGHSSDHVGGRCSSDHVGMVQIARVCRDVWACFRSCRWGLGSVGKGLDSDCMGWGWEVWVRVGELALLNLKTLWMCSHEWVQLGREEAQAVVFK